MDLNQLKHIYFLGIGGIGMSALARYFHQQGIPVSGYDKTPTALTKQLGEEGISIHFEESPERIPAETGLVIYTPAIPAENRELDYLRKTDIPIKKRAEVLGMLSHDKFTIAVAGTHGKTTVTSMIAQIFHEAGKNIAAFAGGIMNNFNSNFAGKANAEIFITEADEFDRSFLQLNPDIAIITSMDADHLDIYGTGEELKKNFVLFAEKIKSRGLLVINNLLELPELLAVKTLKYSVAKSTGIHADNINYSGGNFSFDIITRTGKIENIRMQMPGRHNAENALAAATVALHAGIPGTKIREALESYRGVKRRFEYIIKTPQRIFIDDYAHHPNELKECIRAVKNLYPGKKISGIFQPHLYSRTRDFAKEFAQSLELLDRVILLDIYPAREKPITGITSRIILEKIENANKTLVSKEELPELIKKEQPEILLSLGAGDIDQLVEPLKKVLQR